MKLTIWILLSIATLHLTADAQSLRPSQLRDCRKQLDSFRSASSGDKALLARQLADYKENGPCFAEILLNALSSEPQLQLSAFKKFVQDYQSTRSDKQAGSSTGTGGTTNLVSKGLTAEAVSVAAEYGALTESVNNQTVTVQGTLGGFAAALTRQSLVEYCPSGKAAVGQGPCLNRDLLNALTRISYGISFDASQNSQSIAGTPSGTPQGTAQPVTFTANRHQISQWTGRVALWSTRDVDSKAFKDKLSAALQSAGQAQGQASSSGQNTQAAAVQTAADQLLTSFEAFAKGLGSALDYGVSPPTQPRGPDDHTWINFQLNEQDKLKTASDVDAEFDILANEFVNRLRANPTVISDATTLMMSLSAYHLAEDELITSLAESPVLSFEYDNNRPLGQDETSTFRLIFDKGLGKTWSLTANGAFTIYDTKPSSPAVSRLEDAQVGVQVQKNIGVLFSMPAAVAASYYFQYQNAPSVLNVTPDMPLPGITFTGLPSNATQVFAETGNLHVGQIRLVLNPGKSSVRIPLAVSYSNRTELIAKPTWRAQIGVSYDFDGLFSK